MKFETLGFEKKDLSSIDLSSVEEREELVKRWLNEKASIKRSSGEIENDWSVAGVHQDGIILVQYEKGLQKKVPLKDFSELNGDFFL